MPISLRSIPLALLLAALCGRATAQCTNPWTPENSVGGPTGEAYASHRWDPDGGGPLPERWVLGGDLLVAGGISASRVAAFEPATGTWSALGGGVNARVHAFATLPNGHLVVGGEFTAAGGIPTNRIAVWNGLSWAALGSGFGGTVYALAVLPNGTLVAGGNFTGPSGGGPGGIAVWNGSAWGPLGSGLSMGVVRTLAVHQNGDLFAAGSLLQLATTGPVEWVVRWNGTAWGPVGTAAAQPPFPFHVNFDLLVRANGDLVLVGDSLAAMVVGGHRIATWNGTSWSATPSPPGGTTVFRVAEMTNGDLVAIGSGGYQVYRMTGTSWAELGGGLPVGVARTVLALPGNQLLVAGTVSLGPDIAGVAHWNGAAWQSPGGGAWTGGNARVTARPDGSLVVALTSSPITYVGLRSGGTWTLLGTANHVLALATLPNGDVIAGGRFTGIGGVSANRIAKWDGTSWGQLGGGIGTLSTDYVSSLAVMPNGDLIAGGRFQVAGGIAASCIARFDGASWSAVGSGLGGSVDALAAAPDGTLVAGGAFQVTSGGFPLANIARWNGTLWQTVGPGLNQPVTDLAIRPDGTIAACGQFTLPGPFGSQLLANVAIWNGTWNAIGDFGSTFSVNSLLNAANGDLLVGGSFTSISGVPFTGIARWNGAGWSGFGAGAAGIADMTLAPDGDVGVAGSFALAGGLPSPRVARLSTTCPASVAVVGTVCTGAGSAPALVARSLPWLGTTFRSRATGLPANAIAIEVLGLLPVSVPLPAILPQGVPGCMLTTSPDVLFAHVPNGGIVDLALPLPASIAFVGNRIYQQVAALMLGPGLGIVALTSSNSLELVKGWF